MVRLERKQLACRSLGAKHDANTPLELLEKLSEKNDHRSSLRLNGQTGCLRSNQTLIFY
jgi:hypothetical protein